jgi:hypothetical protein
MFGWYWYYSDLYPCKTKIVYQTTSNNIKQYLKKMINQNSFREAFDQLSKDDKIKVRDYMKELFEWEQSTFTAKKNGHRRLRGCESLCIALEFEKYGIELNNPKN